MHSNVISFDRGLPVVVYRPDKVSLNEVYRMVYRGYTKYYGEKPDWELIFSWKTTIPEILCLSNDYPVIIEYPILGGFERIDYIVGNKRKALIVKTKSWFNGFIRREHICSKNIDRLISNSRILPLKNKPCFP